MSFTVFGDAVLASNRSQPINASIAGAFADIAGAPTASYLVSAAGFVMALNINGMTLGDAPDGWGCSALRDHTDWTPAIATQSQAGRLLDSPGPITGAAALGSDVVAYKATSMYLGRYVGPPLVWAWVRVPGDVGCAAHDSIVTVDTRHYFVGPDDFYVFDGTVPRPIENPVRDFFFSDLDRLNQHKIIGTTDTARDLIYWFYPSKSSGGVLDRVLAYNHKTNRWGFQNITIQAVLRYPETQLTYDTFYGTSTYDDLPQVAYDSPFWQRDDTIPGVFQNDSLMSLQGDPGATWFKTGLVGDLVSYSRVQRMTPSYRRLPSETVSATNFYRTSFHGDEVQESTAQMFKERFDFRREARWHAFRLDQTGQAVIVGMDVDIQPTTTQ